MVQMCSSFDQLVNKIRCVAHKVLRGPLTALLAAVII